MLGARIERLGLGRLGPGKLGLRKLGLLSAALMMVVAAGLWAWQTRYAVCCICCTHLNRSGWRIDGNRTRHVSMNFTSVIIYARRIKCK